MLKLINFNKENLNMIEKLKVNLIKPQKIMRKVCRYSIENFRNP